MTGRLRRALWPEWYLGRLLGLAPAAAPSSPWGCVSLAAGLALAYSVCALEAYRSTAGAPPQEHDDGLAELLRQVSIWADVVSSVAIHIACWLRAGELSSASKLCLQEYPVDGVVADSDPRFLRLLTLVSALHAACFPALFAFMYAGMVGWPQAFGLNPRLGGELVSQGRLALFGYIFVSWVHCSTIMKFSSLVVVLGHHFRDLNRALISLGDVGHHDASARQAERVRAIRGEHMHWVMVGDQLNKAFTVQNLIVVAYFFFKWVRFAYQMLVGRESWSYLAFYFFVTLLCLLMVWYPCICAQQTSNQAWRASRRVLQVVNESIGRPNSAFVDELMEFYEQLHHTPVKFTACNLFPLDGTLVYGVVAAATTYLVVLLQYEFSEDSEE